MPVFHRKAFEAACRTKIPPELTDEPFESWEGLETLLLSLPTDEQRCDAIYGDWLMQLDAPGGTERLAIRDLLIGSGALAANYLAELAQNANDAADGQEAAVRVVLQGDWLVFANDGRKVTPLNQIGLCRFFRHFDLGAPLMQVIGQFGVGFKSSFRVADEVFVESWDSASRFSFRLPITSPTRPNSLPHGPTQQRVFQQLSAVGVRIKQQLLQPQFQGFCTPEFFSSLPAVVEPMASPLRGTHRGTLFAFHLHPEGRAHVASRIQGQVKEVYELCPLFLPWLRTVQIGENELRMKEGTELARDGVSGVVVARRVTLTTSAKGATPSHPGFWRLRGITDGDRWQIALQADSDFKLRLGNVNNQQALSFKDGAAYAYFPLNKVVWPFRFHLHLDLQPNLPRDDWNPGKEVQVRDQLRRAVSGLAAWLEQQVDKRHLLWRVESLLIREPSAEGRNEQERWARKVWETLLNELKNRPLLMTVWGSFVTSGQAVTARLINKEAARQNWTELCRMLHGFDTEFPIVDVAAVTNIGLAELPDARLRQFFLRVTCQVTEDAARRSLVMALFTVESAEPETLERVAGEIQVPCTDGTLQPLSKLMKRPAGSDLPDEWHALFNTLRSWLWEIPHGLTSFFDGQLRFQVKKLSERTFNPRWETLPVALADENTWENHGNDFWNSERDPCPAGCRKVVLQSLRVKDGTNRWKPISNVWLDGNLSLECFRRVVVKWEPSIAGNYDGQKRIREKLRQWQLWDEWANAVEERLRESLAAC